MTCIYPEVGVQFHGGIGQVFEDNGRLGVGGIARYLFDGVQQNAPDALRFTGVGQAQLQFDAPLAGTRIIDDRVRQHLRIRQDDHPAVGGQDLGRAQVDLHDRSLEPFDANRFADVERLLQQEDDPRGKVLHDILQGKTDRKTEDPQAGQEGGHVEEALQGGDRAGDDDRP